MHGRTSVLAALPLPRHEESATADLAASHRALDTPVLSIEGARKHACVISTGAVAVFVGFRRATARPPPRVYTRCLGARGALLDLSGY